MVGKRLRQIDIVAQECDNFEKDDDRLPL